MNFQNDAETLIESFYTLADEVQSLIDRKTILEHKLRFAAEQYQQLADKYAPTAPEISETLAQLQLPPDLHRPSTAGTHVPLPRRGQTGCSQHQIALLIRDGRRAAQQLTLRAANKDASSAAASCPLSTIMEQDFTVEGKKGMLQCPFSGKQKTGEGQPDQFGQLGQDQSSQDQSSQDQPDQAGSADKVEAASEPVLHNTADPICAALGEEVRSQTAPSSAGAVKCPIRFMDQHSAEEIAHYVETHKHELPRSHAICLRRYNKNEEQIRKLDAKYGNLVNMISGLGHLHQPMLPSAAGDGTELQHADHADRAELHRTSNERVENWAQDVSVSAVNGHDSDLYVLESPSPSRDRVLLQSVEDGVAADDAVAAAATAAVDAIAASTDRESHFDRPLKEVRLGESPSRPWGIAVPVSSLPHSDAEPPLSPPAAPVRMPSPELAARCPVSGHAAATGQPGKCPFGHVPPYDHAKTPPPPQRPVGADRDQDYTPRPQMPQQPQVQPQMPSSTSYQQPAFVNFTPPTTATKTDGTAPQMLFTGPVFIGYSMEQAVQFMQHFGLQK